MIDIDSIDQYHPRGVGKSTGPEPDERAKPPETDTVQEMLLKQAKEEDITDTGRLELISKDAGMPA